MQDDTSPVDAGGGPRGSRGGNQVYCNTILDLTSGASVLRLRSNAWDQIATNFTTRDARCIAAVLASITSVGVTIDCIE